MWQNAFAPPRDCSSMVPQTFQAADIGVVAFLVLLEGLLSADNALVLAVMVRHLPRALQPKALLYGLGGAFVFRGIAILLASHIIEFWWLQAIGAAYLLYLPLKHFAHAAQPMAIKTLGPRAGFWRTVIAVELADVAFAIDSVLAAVALVKSQDKIWIVYFGAIIGLVLMRFAAHVFIRLLDRYPGLDALAYIIVGWVGVKLSFMAVHNYGAATIAEGRAPLFMAPEMPGWVFWTVMGLIIGIGTLLSVAAARKRAVLAESNPEPGAAPENEPEPHDETVS